MNKAFLYASAAILSLFVSHINAQISATNIETNTIMDKKSGLMWQRHPIPDVDFKGADTYCRRLELIGAKDWRLPTKEELLGGFKILPHEPGYEAGHTFILWSSTETSRRNSILVFRNTVTSAGTLEREKTWKPGGATLGARCVREAK